MPWILDNTSFSLFFCFDIGHWFCDLLDIMGDTAFCYFNDPQDLYILPLLQSLGWCQVVDNRNSDQKHSKCQGVRMPFPSKCKRFCVIALHKLERSEEMKGSNSRQGALETSHIGWKYPLSMDSYRMNHIANGKSYPIICYPMPKVSLHACHFDLSLIQFHPIFVSPSFPHSSHGLPSAYAMEGLGNSPKVHREIRDRQDPSSLFNDGPDDTVSIASV